jgi:hypothetical protein
MICLNLKVKAKDFEGVTLRVAPKDVISNHHCATQQSRSKNIADI